LLKFRGRIFYKSTSLYKTKHHENFVTYMHCKNSHNKKIKCPGTVKVVNKFVYETKHHNSKCDLFYESKNNFENIHDPYHRPFRK
jgi:hypothetical protein